jgi:LysM domain-containing protein
MSSPTEARAEPCPVCAEPLVGRPPRCFRCETVLGPWWELEQALGSMEPGGPAAPLPASRGWSAVLVAVAVGALLGAAGLTMVRRAPAREAAAPSPTPLPPTPAPLLPPSRLIDYRVQRGDSLWRIAAAVTGDGHRWRELWPEHAGTDGRITAGTVLQVDLSRLPVASPPPSR